MNKTFPLLLSDNFIYFSINKVVVNKEITQLLFDKIINQ